VGQGNGHFNVSSRPLRANSCNANGSVTGLRTRRTARTGGDAGKSLLPVVMSTRASPAQAISTRGVVKIAALDEPTKPSGGGVMWVDASSSKVEAATVDDVAVGEVEIRVDQDCVQASLCVPALETEQACAMRWGVASRLLQPGGTPGQNWGKGRFFGHLLHVARQVPRGRAEVTRRSPGNFVPPPTSLATSTKSPGRSRGANQCLRHRV
jgi:hypothetical protein